MYAAVLSSREAFADFMELLRAEVPLSLVVDGNKCVGCLGILLCRPPPPPCTFV